MNENIKKNAIKVLLTIPALLLGLYRALSHVFSFVWVFIVFFSKITGITYILEPAIKLWETPQPKPTPKPEPQPEDSQEDHDFH